ncbi:hypothetical protein QBS63_15395 [Cronobacter sakazakii]|nr:hypothetical protein [Cronobacter sakazakii]
MARASTLPRIMGHFAHITILSNTASHWAVRMPLGKTVEWDAYITDEERGHYISWASEKKATVPNAGRLTFRHISDERGTEVTLALHFDPPGGFFWRVAVEKNRSGAGGDAKPGAAAF